MKYKNTLLVVNDISRSKNFYRRILGLKVIFDFHGRVTLTSGIVLQSYELWKDLIHRSDDEIVLENYASELYFETDDIDELICTLDKANVTLVHPLKEQTWGQRTVRFYDPDGHIIEVGETLKKVAKRLLSQGFSYEETANQMQVPVDYIKNIKF
ncbi:VOC family protein [Candidatus Stoquefichus sp. SB1]|jgi:catechol 2,3-dioxygenase-like lactoylglutathione lyase family enzyme|uniref:VOC family protein n=1 Tax=Candidatus Stoquefichus sp. SB1 TaxID=1658109 RepID=UPI00067E6DDF|nr:VOC family protein [Candidatus Stoquefichus sp. SB1]